MKTKPDILFLNQSQSPLFLEMNVAVADAVDSGVLYTGSFPDGQSGNLTIRNAPAYKKNSGLSRLLSWTKFMLYVTLKSVGLSGSPLVFVNTNPPLLSFLAYFLYKIRKWDYVILVWDLYPDVLVRFNVVSENNLLVRFWKFMNRRSFSHAKVIITIGDNMAETLAQYLPEDSSHQNQDNIYVIPNWVDIDFIKPIPKDENWFAEKYDQSNKLTVLYSGNMGVTHDLDTLVKAAKSLKEQPGISFLLIGRGTAKTSIEEMIENYQLDNIVLLDRQLYETIPFSMSTGDIAVVSLGKGAEGLSMPSKTYFMMAAGCAIIGISKEDSDLCRTIHKYNIGINIEPGDVDAFIEAIHLFNSDPHFLAKCRRNARCAAEKYFSIQAVSEQYQSLLIPLIKSEEKSD